MAETSGFFNAKLINEKYDRVYNADDFANYFASFIGTGVFIDPMNQLQVYRNISGDDVTFGVRAGRAFIDGYWYELTQDMEISGIQSSDDVYRLIIFKCVLDKTERKISIEYKEYTSMYNAVDISTITPENNSSKHELFLAYFNLDVNQELDTIYDDQITDLRPDSRYCGYVTGLVQSIDSTDMFNQLEAQFNTWFEGMKGQLTEDAAGNLQTQIDTISSGLESTNKDVATNTENISDLKDADANHDEELTYLSTQVSELNKNLADPVCVPLKINSDVVSSDSGSFYVRLGRFVFVSVYATLAVELERWTNYTLATNLPEVDLTYSSNRFYAPVWTQDLGKVSAYQPIAQVSGTDLLFRPMNSTIYSGDNVRFKMWYIAKP
jgi:hypothetical protein